MNELTSWRPFLVVSVTSTEVVNVHEVKNVLLLVQDEEHMSEMFCFVLSRTLPPFCGH